MHSKMSSAICFNFGQSKTLSSGNGLIWNCLKFRRLVKGSELLSARDFTLDKPDIFCHFDKE